MEIKLKCISMELSQRVCVAVCIYNFVRTLSGDNTSKTQFQGLDLVSGLGLELGLG